MARPYPMLPDEDERDDVCPVICRCASRAWKKFFKLLFKRPGWSPVCPGICRFVSWVRKKLKNVFNHPGVDIKLSVEETEPVWLQSSVHPFFSHYNI